jgi:hypothetical protein
MNMCCWLNSFLVTFVKKSGICFTSPFLAIDSLSFHGGKKRNLMATLRKKEEI